MKTAELSENYMACENCSKRDMFLSEYKGEAGGRYDVPLKVYLTPPMWHALKDVNDKRELILLEGMRTDPTFVLLKPYTEAWGLRAIEINPEAFRCIPVVNRTEAVCLAAAKANGRLLVYMENPSEDVCIAAVTQNPLVLKHVKKQTQAIIYAALSQSLDAAELVDQSVLEGAVE